jgi:hypothetical protein
VNTMNVPARGRNGGRRTMRRLGLLASAALIGLGASVASATPASADPIAGVVRIEIASGLDATTPKSVVVPCPVGTKVINAGGYISTGNGKVAMDDIFPNEALTSVTITAKETDAYATAWKVTGFATCATEPLGLEWNWVQSEEDSDDVKSVTAECTEGKTLLGTGATVRGGLGEVAIDEIKPNGGPLVAATEVTVQAVEVDAFTGNWTANAFAICADPLDGQQVISEETLAGSNNNGIRADCDPNQAATGSGAEIVGHTGQVVIDDSYPTDGSPILAPTATTVYGMEEDGTGANWSIRGYVICADV